MRATNGMPGNVLPLAVAFFLIATPLSAQTTLRQGRSLIATLADGQQVAGRLITADSTSLTVNRAGSPFVVERSSIAKLSHRSHRSGPPRIMGTVGAVLGGLFLGAVANGLCEVRCDDAWLVGGLVGGVGGGAFFSTLGSSIGATAPRWDEVSTGAAMQSSRYPRFAAAPCTRNNQWGADAGVIASHRRGYTTRALMTFFCEPEMRSGLEVGYMTRPYAEHPETRYFGTGTFTSTVGDGMSTRYVGLVSERSIGHLPLDPQLVTSIEWHSGATHQVVKTPAPGQQYSSDYTEGQSGLGFGLGLSAGFNPVERISIRAEARAHLTPFGLLNTLSIGGQWRP